MRATQQEVEIRLARLTRPADWQADQRTACDAMEAAGDRLLNATTEAEQQAARADYEATRHTFGLALRALRG